MSVPQISSTRFHLMKERIVFYLQIRHKVILEVAPTVINPTSLKKQHKIEQTVLRS